MVHTTLRTIGEVLQQGGTHHRVILVGTALVGTALLFGNFLFADFHNRRSFLLLGLSLGGFCALLRAFFILGNKLAALVSPIVFTLIKAVHYLSHNRFAGIIAVLGFWQDVAQYAYLA